MTNPEPLVTVEALNLTLDVAGQNRLVLRDVSLSIERGEAVGLVGESGAGKSMTAKAIARLLPPRAVTTGAITFAGHDMLSLRGEPLRQTRGDMAVIFQDPRAYINPVRRIGDFLTERLRTVTRVDRHESTRRAQKMLSEVGFTDTARRMRQYPSDLSGGMLQRVMMASALLGDLKLILADEPTTALDVTTQSDVMAILNDLRHNAGVALLFITHDLDLDLASAVCDRTAVMYAEQIVEVQKSGGLHDGPPRSGRGGVSRRRRRREGRHGCQRGIRGPGLAQRRVGGQRQSRAAAPRHPDGHGAAGHDGRHRHAGGFDVRRTRL